MSKCREDGRCQQAIDYGMEWAGSCAEGKCVQPPADDPAVDVLFDVWMEQHGREGLKTEMGVEELMEGAFYAGARANRRAVREKLEVLLREALVRLVAIEPNADNLRKWESLVKG